MAGKKGFSIGIGADTEAFRQGVEGGVIDPLEDATEALQDLGEDKSLEELEKDLTVAQTTSKELATETKKTAQEIKQRYRESYREMKQAAEAGFGSSSEAAKEFKQEATQNFSQLAGSFKGDMGSIADAAQGVFGGLAGSLTGPAALVSGVLGGVAGASLKAWTDSAEKTKEAVRNMYDDMLASGLEYRTAEQVQSVIADIGRDDAQYDQVVKDAERTGLAVQTLLRAQAGDTAALAEVQAELAQRMSEANAAAEEYSKTTAGMANAGGVAGPAEAEIANLTEMSRRYTEIEDSLSSAASKIREVRGAQEQTIRTYQEQELAIKASAKSAEELAEELKNLPPSSQFKLELDTTELDRELNKTRPVKVRLVTRDGREVQ